MLEKEDIRVLLQEMESDRIERTVSIKDTDKFCQAICAFANDFPHSRKPGYLFIGVKDNGKLSGLKVTDELLLNISNIRSEGNILPQPAMSVDKYSFDEGDVVVVEVQPSKFPPVRYKGRIWIRTGPRKAVANETEELILIERRNSTYLTFDEHPVHNAKIEDLQLDIFRIMYLPKAVSPDILNNDKRDPRLQLASLHFYDLERDRPTVAGVLMFGKTPQYFMPGAYVQYVKFAGPKLSSDVLAEKIFEGNFIDMVWALDSFVKTIIIEQRPVRVSALTEKMIQNYPSWAIRELLMNAIMHRSYETNVGIKFYQFSDRLEIVNPGGLYGSARPDNFPYVNDYRNLILSGAMKVMGFVNKFNRGIETTQEYLKKNGNPPAVFDFDKITVFGVNIFQNPVFTEQEATYASDGVSNEVPDGVSNEVSNEVPDGVSDRVPDVTDNQMLILDEFLKDNKISMTDLAKKIGISRRKILDNINKLKEKGLLKRVGNNKTGYWKIIN